MNITASESYVIFELGKSSYALPSKCVQHIEMVEHITVVPNANPAIDGVVFSRGQLIPALNLRARFNLEREAPNVRTRIVFVSFKHRTVGLIVDTAREFVTLAPENIKPIEESLTGVQGKYLKAITSIKDRLVLILDLEAVLKMEDAQFAEALESEAQLK